MLNRNRVLGFAVVVAAVVGFAAPAFATGFTGYDPTSDLTGLITNNIPLVATLVVAVAGLLVGFYLLQWGIRTVMSKIRRGVHV
jgi:hypothetical protein